MFILLFYQIVGATLLIGKGRNQINRVCGKKLNVTFLILVIKMYIFFIIVMFVDIFVKMINGTNLT